MVVPPCVEVSADPSSSGAHDLQSSVAVSSCDASSISCAHDSSYDFYDDLSYVISSNIGNRTWKPTGTEALPPAVDDSLHAEASSGHKFLSLVAAASSQADAAGLVEFTENLYRPPSVSNPVLNVDSSFRNLVAIDEFADNESENSFHGTVSSLADAPHHVSDKVGDFVAALPSDSSQGTL